MYSIPINIIPNKIFIVYRSNLIGRIDAPVYKNLFCFNSNIYKVVNLSEIAYINPNTSFSKLDRNDVITFVPMEAINEYSGSITESFTKKVFETNGFTRFKEGDLIWAKITPCMQNGKSAIVRNTINGYACGSTEFFIIRPKTQSVLVEYLHFLLRDEKVLNTAQNYFGGSAGQQRVSKDFLVNFKVPLPPLEIQRKIVDKIQAARNQRKKNENLSSELLASIDKLILSELGISLPEQNNSLQNRIFISKFSEVVGLRLDPLYFKNNDKIESSIYENFPLRKIAYTNKGQSITKDKISQGNYPVIAGGQSSPYSHSEYNFEGNIITVSASGAYSGFVWYHDYPIFASDCIVLQSKDENEVSTQFLYYVLKALQQEIYKHQQGAGQPHVYARDIEKIIIPKPSIAKQIEMLNHIKEIQEKIKLLQSEAITVLETAKQEVENMILGN